MSDAPDDGGRGRVLLALAEGSIVVALRDTDEEIPRAPFLDEPGAVFVTLHRAGVLRGCIGTLEAYRPLRDDVRHNARAAAFHDPRFPALTADELEGLVIEVSELGRPERFDCTSEADAHARLRPGEDGVILTWNDHRATFLPQVWAQLPAPPAFLRQLKIKAGLAGDFWDERIELERYRVRVWR